MVKLNRFALLVEDQQFFFLCLKRNECIEKLARFIKVDNSFKLLRVKVSKFSRRPKKDPGESSTNPLPPLYIYLYTQTQNSILRRGHFQTQFYGENEVLNSNE